MNLLRLQAFVVALEVAAFRPKLIATGATVISYACLIQILQKFVSYKKNIKVTFINQH